MNTIERICVKSKQPLAVKPTTIYYCSLLHNALVASAVNVVSRFIGKYSTYNFQPGLGAERMKLKIGLATFSHTTTKKIKHTAFIKLVMRSPANCNGPFGSGMSFSSLFAIYPKYGLKLNVN